MSLMQLLAVGKSVDRVSGEPGRYRPAEPGMVPDFRGSGTAQEPNLRMTMNKFEAERAVVGVAPSGSSSGSSSRSSAGVRQRFPLGRWTAMRNPFHKLGRRGESPMPVQGELMLDAVKPVRNDLTDSDLMVVQGARPVPVPVPGPVSVSVPMPTPATAGVASATRHGGEAHTGAAVVTAPVGRSEPRVTTSEPTSEPTAELPSALVQGSVSVPGRAGRKDVVKSDSMASLFRASPKPPVARASGWRGWVSRWISRWVSRGRSVWVR